MFKNINHILQKRPGLIDKEIKCFFCNFNEPYYIKIEKLEILASICNEKNLDIVIQEMKEYVNETDPDFVKRSVKSLCTISIRIEKSIDR